MGCDEYHAGEVTGPLYVAIAVSPTNAVVGYPIGFTALIDGRVSASEWDFGDGVVVSNRPLATHAWTVPGGYPVILRAYNEDHPAGVSAIVSVQVTEGIHYVAFQSRNPVPPYTSWATAAASIQDAVDAATEPGASVLVTDGIYYTGGRAVGGSPLTNRVVVDKPLPVRSVNGPQSTMIAGNQVPGTTNGDRAVRCVYLANGASLSGFTLTGGATCALGDPVYEQSGGGLWCDSTNVVVSNCVLTANSAASRGGGVFGGTLSRCTLIWNSARLGGGASGTTLDHCLVTGNSSSWYGGGAHLSVLNDCTVTQNAAQYGGGVSGGTLQNCTLTGNAASAIAGGADRATLNNCIVYLNTAATSASNYQGGVFSYCCTSPEPVGGAGNITCAPSFVDYVGGNLRLQSNSPCINSGNNACATNTLDLDGNPRIVSGAVDIGAYEFQGAGSVISYAWLQQYSLPTDGSADFTDLDGDGLDTCQEWRCLTDPTNALSVLRLLSVSSDGAAVTVAWQGVVGVTYFIERSTDLGGEPPFVRLVSGLPGQPGPMVYRDAGLPILAPQFYRLGVIIP